MTRKAVCWQAMWLWWTRNTRAWRRAKTGCAPPQLRWAAITTGPNVQIALFAMVLLEGMIARNLSVHAAARATGFTPQSIKLEHALAAKAAIAKMNAFEPLWADQLHRLIATDPDLFA